MQYVLVIPQPSNPHIITLTNEEANQHPLNPKQTNLNICQYLASTNANAVYVYTGPGSFTGVRLGIVASHTYAYVYSLPIYGFDMLDLWITDQPDRPVYCHYQTHLYGYDPESKKKQFYVRKNPHHGLLVDSAYPPYKPMQLIHLIKKSVLSAPYQLPPPSLNNQNH